ncbi:MAG: cell surface protein SprA [Gemmatimonadaceae bacterium]
MRVLRFLAAVAAFARLVGPSALGAQTPVPRAPVPRVDSVRVDTLHPPAADSARRVLMPKPPTVTDTVKKPGLFGPNSDLSVDVRTRIEAKGERHRDERCNNGQLSALLAISLNCQASFTPAFGFDFTMVSTGTVADRVHVNVDYDTQREFDASNAVNVYYEGKATDKLQRLEVGNVSFTLPSTRFLSSGVPSGNYGLQAVAKLGRFRFQGIAAQQKGNIVQDRVFYVGDRTLQTADREIKDNEIEPRRFFFTVDPQSFKGYPNVDILNRAQLANIANTLSDTIRPRRIVLYRVQFGTQPQNPNGPRFRIIGDPGEGRQTYDVLREGVDYYLDPSQLWFALVRPLNQSNERLVVAYTLLVNGVETVVPSVGGTPDLQYAGPASDQRANLVYDPNVVPGQPAFRREIRSVYRIAGEELVRSSTRVRVVSGAGEQEKPVTGPFATFLQMFGLAQSVNPASFDIENRLWPRPSDPNYSAAAGGTAGLASAASLIAASGVSTGRIIRDHFVVFPVLHPFASRDSGLVVPGNPTNDAVYTTPGEYLYSTQHPPNVYRLKVGYSTESSADAGAINLGSVQVRRGSERVLLDGRPLIRDVDYRVDYELGRLTFARPETLFTRQRAVTVKFEENPLFAIGSTKLYGLTSTLSLANGELNLIAVQQSQNTDFTRPQLGFEPVSSLLAGVNGQLSWAVSPLTRLVNKLPFVDTRVPSRISLQGEIATSRPQLNSSTQAYIESFEGDAGIAVNLSDQAWALSSQPADGHLLPRRLGANPFDLRLAATLAFQNNGTNPTTGSNILIPRDSIDANASFLGISSTSYEQVLWMTLYPLGIGGRYDPGTRTAAWTISNTPQGRRYRSMRTVLSPAGLDLSRSENLEFWALVDTNSTRRTTNPTLVFDFGEISENRVAYAPETLYVRPGSKPDSLFRGRKLQGLDSLDTERDPISRAFNAEVNDKGLLGDVVDTLAVDNGGVVTRMFNVPICTGTSRAPPRLGDTRTNCTVRNNRLDEEDIDLDNVLNLKTAQRNQERLQRFVIDLGDARKWVRFGKSFRQQIDSAGPVKTLQWVLVRVPFRAADDTVNDVLLRRVRALRVTMISGAGTAPDEFIQTPIARLKLTGAPWLKRNDQTLAGIAGETPAGGYIVSGLIGTADKGTTSGDDYQPPPGVTDEADTRAAQFSISSTQINERSLRLQGGNLPVYGRAEAFYRFPNGQQSFMGYQQLRLWARGRRNGWGPNGELQMYVKVGRDANNFYLYRTPVMSGPGVEAWNPEVRVDFNRFFALRQKLQNAYLANKGDTLQCTGVDAALVNASATPAAAGQQRYVACDGGYMVYTVEPGAAPPNLAAVQEMAVGFVRLPTTGGAPSVIGPADSLELWVDDIRLGQVVNNPGYAGQVSVALSAADIADVRVGFTRKNPYFRQLTDQPSFVDDRVLDVVGTIHLEKLLPIGLGLSVPLTITHISAASTPVFLSGTDIPGAGVQNLRSPSTGITTYAMSVRRTAALSNPLLGALIDNLGLTSTYTSGDSRNEYQRGNNDNFALSLDYSVAADPRTARVPGVFGLPMGLVPGVLRSGADSSNAPPVFRWNPTVLRFSSGVVRGSDRRFTFFKPADAFDDSARVSRNDQNLWRNSSTLEFRPTTAFTARWDFISLRDLRDYGDTTASSRAATEQRSHLLGANVGMERERSLLTSFGFAPQRSQWFRPRADFGTQYGMLRDPNFGALVPLSFGNTVTVNDTLLPRRITVSQNLGGGVTIDLGRMLTIYSGDSSLARRLAKVFAPFDINVNRSLLSAFDGANAGSPLGLQFGLGGVDAFRQANGQLAATTGLTQALSASQSFLFPGNIAFVNRYRRTTTRSWTRRIGDEQSVADGAQTVFPDVSLRWNWTPPLKLRPVFKSLGANAGYARSLATSFLPGDEFGQRPELRGSRVRTIPLNTSVLWGFGRGLTTSAGYTVTTRTDSLPGSVADGKAEEMSVDVGRAFKFPKSLGFTIENDVRARIGWQQTRSSTFISDLSRGGISRLADNGRSAVSLNADTDLSETVIFTLQGSRVITYDNNFNRRATQYVLSTVLQVQFFGEPK